MKHVLILLCAVFTGALLLTAAYAIPVGPIRKHVEQSLSTIMREGDYPSWASGFFFTKSDEWTGHLSISIAMNEGEGSPLVQAMKNAYLRYPDGSSDKHDEYIKLNLQQTPGGVVAEYGRYWHGYIVLLKPLLFFLPIPAIRVLNFLLQFSLAALLLIRMVVSVGKRQAIAFLPALLLLSPITLALCLDFSPMYLITLFAMHFLLSCSPDRTRGFTVFFVIGIATSFFDLLTFPVLSLGLPLILYLLRAFILQNEQSTAEHRSGLKPRMLDTVLFSIAWGVGYAAMWVSKWILGTLVSGTDILSDAGAEASGWLGGGNLSAYRLGQLEDFASRFLRPPVILAAILALGILIAVAVFIRRRMLCLNLDKEKTRAFALPILFVSLYPFFWYLAMPIHSVSHIFFTYRLLAIFVYGLCVILCGCYSRKRKEGSEGVV